MSEVVHPNHPHILYSATHDRLYTCSGCKEHGHNHAYQCKQERCNFNLHSQCATAARSVTHHFLGRHVFHLHYSPPPGKRWVCEACFRDVGGFAYHCEKKGWSLHPCCAKLDPIFKTGVEGIELRLKSNISSKCRWCGVRKPHDRPGGWSYVSNCGNFHFHLGCIKDAMVESWSKPHMRYEGGDDRALVVQKPTNGIVLHDDGGRRRLELVRYDGSTDLARRLKRYWQVSKALFRCVLSAFLGTPPSLEVVQLVATIFQK